MKKHLALLTLLLIGTLSYGQNFDAPEKGAKIYAQEYMIHVDSGSETTFDLWIVRSRFAKRAEFMAPSLMSSSALAFEVAQDPENKDHYTVTVSANEVEAGQYTTTVSARSNGTQKVTGTTLSFNVVAAQAVASKDGK
ncbi:MAG: hypothetical protein RLN88_09300 [Ekhidna sp.]|uniref:hypothetical protein n=1 Tax=Ekhidna sp. TaxID=2608089 RepID=UPI0032EC9833